MGKGVKFCSPQNDAAFRPSVYSSPQEKKSTLLNQPTNQESRPKRVFNLNTTKKLRVQINRGKLIIADH